MDDIKLTKTDRKILESYISVINGLAEYLSDSYEFVLHSLEDLDHSAICVINGEHTGRTVGAPITDLALRMLGEFSAENRGNIVYFSKNKNGEPLKSTTIAIRGENNRIIGLLCINMYLNTPLVNVIESLTQYSPVQNMLNEDFSANIDDAIETAYEQVKTTVMADDTILPSNKNKAIVEALYDKGIFKLKDSVVKMEKLMGISKNTIYMHIRNYKKK